VACLAKSMSNKRRDVAAESQCEEALGVRSRRWEEQRRERRGRRNINMIM
jgi:hypothetical protein